jgi:hypothetical protein
VTAVGTGTGALTHRTAAGSTATTVASSTERSPAHPSLIVTDAESATARVVDTQQRRVSGSFPLAAVASAYSGSTQRYGYAVQADGDLTSVIDTTARVPTMLGNSVVGQRPIHFVAHGGRIALFHDESGSATVVRESTLDRPRPRSWTFETGREHHGVAVPMDRRVLLSMPNPADEEDELPVGIEVRTLRDRVLQRFPDCAGLHGEASSGDLVAFGCANGVLVLEQHGDHFHSHFIDAPQGTDGRRVGTLRAADGVPFMLGNWGPDALVRVGPEAEKLQPIALPGTSRSFDLHPAGGGTAIVLATDGQLHAVEALSGDVLASVPVVAEFGTSGTRPALVVGDRFAYVSDPRTGRVTEVSLPDLRVTARIPVGGAPASLALVD